MSSSMDFRLLGSLEVRVDDRPRQLGTPKERALLCFFLLHPNEIVPVDRLLEALWPERDAAAARRTLEVHVSRLRATLTTAEAAQRLASRRPGYVLRVEPGERDNDRFERLLDTGTRALASDDTVEAAVVLRDALALRRGTPLADVAYESFAQPEIARLEELFDIAVDARIEADLRLGRHAHLIAELTDRVAKEPRHERRWRQLMVALYRSGRQQEALRAYQDLRGRLLVLGLEPSPETRELERAILAHEPWLLEHRAKGVPA